MAIEKRQVHIIGGGTVSHVRAHLALAAFARGTTAHRLVDLCRERFREMDVHLHLTDMAGGYERLSTNEDVAALLDRLVADLKVKVIFLPVALVDFEGVVCSDGPIPSLPPSKSAPRLKTKDGGHVLLLKPKEKLLDRIRAKRKDITLVAFKTTTGATEHEQYLAALDLLKRASCNLVLANDLETRVNMIVTPEEARYHVTKDRCDVIRNLVDMTWHRSHLTFTRSTVVAGDPIPWLSPSVPTALRSVVNHLIDSGAYKPFRGATVGHFAVRLETNKFLTSIRRTNFNDLHKHGLVEVRTDGPDRVFAFGAKPSVGGQSQRIVFEEHPGTDCIVHAHVPMLDNHADDIPVVSQREYECGSHECGRNCSRGLKRFELPNNEFLYAVHLAEHGPNIVFSKVTNPYSVIDFIERNFSLTEKTGGPVSLS